MDVSVAEVDLFTSCLRARVLGHIALFARVVCCAGTRSTDVDRKGCELRGEVRWCGNIHLNHVCRAELLLSQQVGEQAERISRRRGGALHCQFGIVSRRVGADGIGFA